MKAQFSDFEPGWPDDAVIVSVEVPKQKVVKVTSSEKKTMQAAA